MAECELNFESADTCCITHLQLCSRAINDKYYHGRSAEARIVRLVRV
jgi:hypothetical protein